MIDTENFVAHLRSSGRSEKTIKLYLMFLKAFLSSIDTDVAHISYDNHVVPFLSKYSNQNTRNTCKMALRNYFRYHGRSDLLQLIRGVKIGRKVELLPSQVEVLQLIKSIPDKKVLDKTLIVFLYSTGLRVDECCQCRKFHVDFKNKWVFVKFGKMGHERNVRFIPDITFELLKTMWSKRRTVSEYAFVDRHGRKLNVNQVGYIIKKWWTKLNIEKKCHPHTLRKCYVTHSIDQGAKEIIVSKNAGHSSLSVTLEKYFMVECLVGKISNPYLYPWNEVIT
ncbi:MAG: tyrosine-type recombinase/integrase [Nanoarchaeota archaeon]|nr:tyrosine-type recombinase/integrase [Nanoarchaeota archaeon]